MQVSVTISGFTRLFDNDLRAVVEAARVADAAGVHQLVVPDHVVTGPSRAPRAQTAEQAA